MYKMYFQGEELPYFNVENFVSSIFGDSQHKKRIRSIANAALGIISSGSLIIHRIGHGMADALNLSNKHAIKQVDRLLSNEKLNITDAAHYWIPYIIGSRQAVKITMDWTDFDGDKQTTLSLNLVTSHGRATPLLWKTVSKNKLKNNRNRYEDELLTALRDCLPQDVRVTILADRGFCDIKLFAFLEDELHFDYIIRIRGNILVENSAGEKQRALDWVGKAGKTKTIKKAKITNKQYEVNLVACKHAKGMKAPWCIVSSSKEVSGSWAIRWYEKRWGCEPQFRDIKDLHFGMGLSSTHIKNTERRDRLLLIHAIATVILTLLGAAGEKIGLDKYLKSNTAKKRSLSLFRQGCIYFRRLLRMAKDTAEALMSAFCHFLIENKKVGLILGVI